MTLIQSLILALTQGIAEFLPISSKGHLNLVSHLLGLQPTLAFDIFLNTATLISVLFFFRSQIKYFFDNLFFIILGTIPAVLATLLLRHHLDYIFSDIKILPYFFIAASFLLISTKFIKPKNMPLDFKKALIIGIFQALAILPGVSRSGSTILAGLLVGLSPIDAFQFSFCLLIPASVGAIVFDAKDLANINLFSPNYLIGFVVTAIIGVIALTLLKKLLISNKIWLFGVYTFILSIVLLLIVK